MKNLQKVFKGISKYLYFVLGVVAIFSIGIVYTVKIGQNEEKDIRNKMFVLTQNFAGLLDAQKFKTLQFNLTDETNPDYVYLREKLLELGRLNKAFGIRWIYTMVPQNGQIVFSVDSIPNDSLDYSPPGDFYTDANRDMIAGVNDAWTSGKSSITSPYTDQWGSFITTIVPVVDKSTNQTVSVLASDMDYVSFYKNTMNSAMLLPIFVTIFSEIAFSIVFFYVVYLLRDKKDLLGKNIVLKQYVEHVPGVFFQYQLFPDGTVKMPFTSRRIWDIFEVHREDVKEDATKIFTHVKPEDLNLLKTSIEKSKEKMEEWNCDFRVDLSRGTRWLRGKSKPEKLPDGSILWYGYVTDITPQKEMEIEMENKAKLITQEINELEVANMKLKENRESILGLMTDMAKAKKALEVDDLKMKTIISSMGEGLVIVNKQYKISLINPKALELFCYSDEDISGESLHEII